MKFFPHTIARFMIAIVVLLFGHGVRRRKHQKPKAAKADRPAAAQPKKLPAAQPKAPAAKAAPKPAAPQPAAEVEMAPEDPAVAAILETKPATPAECCRAAKTLADLGHPDLCKRFLKKVLDAKPDAANNWPTWARSSARSCFSIWPARPALLPEARQLADAVVAATAARRRTPNGLPA